MGETVLSQYTWEFLKQNFLEAACTTFLIFIYLVFITVIKWGYILKAKTTKETRVYVMILNDGLKHKEVQIINASYFENINKRVHLRADTILEDRKSYNGKKEGLSKRLGSDKAVSELPKELAVGYSFFFLSLKTYVVQLWVNPWPASSVYLNCAGKATEIQNKSWLMFLLPYIFLNNSGGLNTIA